MYFQAVDKYVNVVTPEGEVIRLSLKDAEQFCQIHRSTIVNMACVASANRDELGKVMLTLRNRPEKLKVSVLYAHLFRQM